MTCMRYCLCRVRYHSLLAQMLVKEGIIACDQGMLSILYYDRMQVSYL